MRASVCGIAALLRDGIPDDELDWDRHEVCRMKLTVVLDQCVDQWMPNKTFTKRFRSAARSNSLSTIDKCQSVRKINREASSLYDGVFGLCAAWRAF